MRAPSRLAWIAVLPFLAASCASVGPQTIPRDRTGYVQAIRDSWKRQLLLNMVALRYGEAPMFLEVTSVINQYSLEGQASAAAGWSEANLGDRLQIGLGGAYADRPTITYSPLTGERYVRSMLTPASPASIVGMVQAGWPVDFILRLTVRSINGLANAAGTRLMGTGGSSDFFRVLQALRHIQLAGGIGVRLEHRGPEGSAVLFFPGPAAETLAGDLRLVREKLRLPEGATEFPLAFGAVPSQPGEIAMLTRSMIEVLIELATWIDVPQEHVTEGRTIPSQEVTSVDGVEATPLIRVHAMSEEPPDPFAAVFFRDHWFSIDDRDLPSKRVFSFMMLLLSLAESGGGQDAPVVTIQAGK